MYFSDYESMKNQHDPAYCILILLTIETVEFMITIRTKCGGKDKAVCSGFYTSSFMISRYLWSVIKSKVHANYCHKFII